MDDRLRDGIMRLIEYYDLPRGEVWDVLHEEDYPPLIEGDLGEYYDSLLQLEAENIADQF